MEILIFNLIIKNENTLRFYCVWLNELFLDVKIQFVRHVGEAIEMNCLILTHVVQLFEVGD